MWLPPGIAPDEEKLMTLTETHAPKDRVADMMQVFEQMDRYHPKDSCWYLPLIGVDPAQQGRGCGSALLQYALSRCDRDGVPAYLESSNPRNISLYLRHGFEIIGNIQVGSSPTMAPMLRRPR
jgi:ribosomal protein S18 acetylase RimI-like enzyme